MITLAAIYHVSGCHEVQVPELRAASISKKKTPQLDTENCHKGGYLSLNRPFWEHKSTNRSDRGCYIASLLQFMFLLVGTEDL